MKRQVKTISVLLFLFSLSTIVYSQNTKVVSTTSTSPNFKNDSLELKAMVIKLLKWHQTDKRSDFEPLTNNATDSIDSIYTGINWQLHKRRLTELEATNFFSAVFLDNYQNIATHLDKELKSNKTKYFVGDLPPYGNEASEWCNCQDYPGDAWKRLKIINVKINDNLATFNWTWGNNLSYAVKAIKENSVWRIAALEKFTIKNFSW